MHQSAQMLGQFEHPKRAIYLLGAEKQRLEAVLAFLLNDVKAFGSYFKDFGGTMRRLTGPDFIMKVAKLPTRAEVLRWYLAINAGGTPHTPEEINRVRGLLAKEEKK